MTRATFQSNDLLRLLIGRRGDTSAGLRVEGQTRPMREVEGRDCRFPTMLVGSGPVSHNAGGRRQPNEEMRVVSHRRSRLLITCQFLGHKPCGHHPPPIKAPPPKIDAGPPLSAKLTTDLLQPSYRSRHHQLSPLQAT